MAGSTAQGLRRGQRALRFAYEIVADELRTGHPGHDNVMVALEVLAQIEKISPERSHDPLLLAFEQYTVHSYSAQKLRSSEREAFIRELSQLEKVLAQTRR